MPHYHTYNNSLVLTKLLLTFIKTYTYILTLLIDVPLQLNPSYSFDKMYVPVVSHKDSLHHGWSAPILPLHQGLTTSNHTFVLIEVSPLFFQSHLFRLIVLCSATIPHAHKIFCCLQLLQVLNNQKYQYKVSKLLIIHIFLNINHKNHRPE